MFNKVTTESFIERCKDTHKDTYDYSITHYEKMTTNVDIICKVHGKFSQRPDTHLLGAGCPKCKRNRGGKRISLNVFKEYCADLHDNKYDYSQVKYRSIAEKVTIICPEHGEFKQVAANHKRGQGCPYCAASRRPKTKLRENMSISTKYKLKQALKNPYIPALIKLR